MLLIDAARLSTHKEYSVQITESGGAAEAIANGAQVFGLGIDYFSNTSEEPVCSRYSGKYSQDKILKDSSFSIKKHSAPIHGFVLEDSKSYKEFELQNQEQEPVDLVVEVDFALTAFAPSFTLYVSNADGETTAHPSSMNIVDGIVIPHFINMYVKNRVVALFTDLPAGKYLLALEQPSKPENCASLVEITIQAHEASRTIDQAVESKIRRVMGMRRTMYQSDFMH